MNIMTPGGGEIYLVPECVRCKITGQNPVDMDECPICNFDDTGDICVPELCEEYMEE